MDPTHGRDEYNEDTMHGFIRGDEFVGDIDVTHQYLNDSGDGDESLNTGGRSSSEVHAGASGEGGHIGSDEGESDEGEADGSGEVHIYIFINESYGVYIHINALSSFSPPDRGKLQYGRRNEAQPRRWMTLRGTELKQSQ